VDGKYATDSGSILALHCLLDALESRTVAKRIERWIPRNENEEKCMFLESLVEVIERECFIACTKCGDAKRD
jgi:hypothetical protein